MKVARLVKRVSIVFSILLLVLLVPVIWLLTLDPNDFKPQIQSLAAEQGVELQINGDIDWQLYPTLALEVADVSLATEQPALAIIAHLDSAWLHVNLRPLLSKQLSVRGLRVRGVDLALTETAALPEPEVAQTSPAAASSAAAPAVAAKLVELADLTITYQPLEGDAISLAVTRLQLEQVNLEGNAFPANLALDLDYGAQSVSLQMQASLSLDLAAEEYRLESRDMQVALGGEQPLNTRTNLVAEANLADGSWKLELEDTRIDDLTAFLAAEGQIDPLTAKGKVQIDGGAQLLTRLSGLDLLHSFALESDFDLRPNVLLIDSLKAQINDSSLEVALEYVLDGQQFSQLELSLDQINIDDYLPAEPAESPAADRGENPLLALEAVPPLQADIRVGRLQASGYEVTDLHLNAEVRNSVARLQLHQAGLADGAIQADLLLQALAEPQVRINSFSAETLQLAQLVRSEDGAALVAGVATADFNGTLQKLYGDNFLAGFNGDGNIAVENLRLETWNVEQSICVAAQRLGGTVAARSSWPGGTEFAAFRSPISVRDGVVGLDGIRTGFGNIALTGGGDMNLASLDFSAQLSLLVEGERTSEHGCSINKYLRNTQLPLSCAGNLGAEGEVSCGLDNAVVQALLSGAVQGELQKRLENFLAPKDEENTEEEVAPDPTKELFREAIKGILRPR